LRNHPAAGSAAPHSHFVFDDAARVWPWAAQMKPDVLETVNASLVVKRFVRGEYVCRSGEHAEHWYGVAEGLVKMSTVTAAGRDVSFIGIATGGWFGEGTLLKSERRRYDVVALRDSDVVLMPRRVFLSLCAECPEFTQWLLLQLNERLSQFIALLANDRTSSSTDVRVARALAWMFNPYLYPGMSSDIPITQEEIAHLASVSRARTNEALHRLEALDLIKIGYAHVEVLDIDRLRNFGD
jgi:CRP/FNR family cyclic AMP-dependent transcriptional regulator